MAFRSSPASLAYPSKPFQQCCVDLGRTLLLNPVAGAVDDPNQPQIGDMLAHDFHEIDAGYEGENRIKLARDEGSRLFDPAIRDRLLLGKVELCRAVTVQRSTKAALRELPDIVVDIGRA